MSATLTVIYDDRIEPPTEIASVIGAGRFSEIIHRRVTIGESMRKEFRAGGAEDLFHLLDSRDAAHLADLVENSPANRVFLWLPSCFLPRVPGALAHLVRKSRFGLRTTFLSQPVAGLAPLLLSVPDLLLLLRAQDKAIEREVLANLAETAPVIFDHCRFTDLRDLGNFFDVLSGATEPRHFNAMRIKGRVYVKSSSDRRKMQAEYGFFHIAPEAMKPFLIPTFDYFEEPGRAGYAMERVAVPDAALQLIHHAFDDTTFGRFVGRFAEFLAIRAIKEVGDATVRVKARTAILEKMTQRLDHFLETPAGAKLDQVLDKLGPIGSLRSMMGRAVPLLEQAIARDPSTALAIGHGDSCFSNILFDGRTSLFRLIDPRGATSLDEAWMHPLYDVAKFSHSVLGGYDFINNDLFDCVIDDGLALSLKLHDNGAPQAFRDLFTTLVRNRGHDLRVVRAYEMSLFMSMLPLHSDHPRKLVAFALVAAGLIQTLEAGDVR